MDYHYTYIITNTVAISGTKYYIGVRSSCVPPECDSKYLGSSKYLTEDIEKLGVESFKKDILAVFSSRSDAMDHEIELHDMFNVKNNDLFYNKANSVSTGFTWSGPHTAETKEIIREKRNLQKVSDEQIEKFKTTWRSKTEEEKQEYSIFRSNLWRSKSDREKQEFSKKMSTIGKNVWKNCSQEHTNKRVENILKRKNNRTAEEKQLEYENRSKAQSKAKNNRSEFEISQQVAKRKKTYNNMSSARKEQIKQKHRAAMLGRKWYNNGDITKMFHPENVPNGFIQGRKI